MIWVSSTLLGEAAAIGDCSGTAAAEAGQYGFSPTSVVDAVEPRVGTLVGNVMWHFGRSGRALRLHGNGDYVQFATHEPRCNAATGFSWATRLMFWQLPSVAGANAYGPAYLVADGYAWTLYGASATDTLRASIRDAAGENLTTGALATITIGRWFDVVAVFDGSALAVYVDGALVGTLSPGSILAGEGTMLRWGLGSTNSPEAIVEHCMFWDRALTAAEVMDVTADPFGMFEAAVRRSIGRLGRR